VSEGTAPGRPQRQEAERHEQPLRIQPPETSPQIKGGGRPRWRQMLPLRRTHHTRAALVPRPHRPPVSPPTRDVRRSLTQLVQPARKKHAASPTRKTSTRTRTRAHQTRTTPRASRSILRRVEEDAMNTPRRWISASVASSFGPSQLSNAIHKHNSHYQTPLSNAKQWRTIAIPTREIMAGRHKNNGRQGLKQWRGKNGNTPCVIRPNVARPAFPHVNPVFCLQRCPRPGR
jgi:hypothetical protein